MMDQYIIGIILVVLVKTAWSTPTIIETPVANQTITAGSNINIIWSPGTAAGNTTFNLWITSSYRDGNSTNGATDRGVIGELLGLISIWDESIIRDKTVS
jgi:hypothetical protein